MKNFYYLLIITLFSLQNSAVAQEKPEFGVKAGINFSDYTGRGYEDFSLTDGRTVFHLGLFVDYELSPIWSVQPELLYSEQGYVIKSSTSLKELEIPLKYLQLPLMAELALPKGFSLHAGPQLGYLLNKDSLPGKGENGVEFNYNAFDFSFAVGAEYRFQSFFVSARYNAGVNRIVNSNDIQTHNRVIQVGIGIVF